MAITCTLDLSADDIRRLVERARKLHTAGIVVGPTAIVADIDVVFGMARMYAILSELAHAPVDVFRDQDAALAWLDDFDNARGASPRPG